MRTEFDSFEFDAVGLEGPIREKWQGRDVKIVDMGLGNGIRPMGDVPGSASFGKILTWPFIGTVEAKSSRCFSTDGVRMPGMALIGINGIRTSFEAAQGHAEYLRSFTAEHQIDWIYNQTHGVGVDLAEVLLMNYVGFSSNPARLLLERWKEFHEGNPDKPCAKILQVCHSQGAIHVKNALMAAPKEIRDRVIVVAIAPAAVVPREVCFRSYNYASKRDVVHYGELMHQGALNTNEYSNSKALDLMLENRKELVLLDPHPDAPLFDHDFQSPTFYKILKELMEEYATVHGIYV